MTQKEVINKIENRILILQNREKENSRIIYKLKRRLRKLGENTND